VRENYEEVARTRVKMREAGKKCKSKNSVAEAEPRRLEASEPTNVGEP